MSLESEIENQPFAVRRVGVGMASRVDVSFQHVDAGGPALGRQLMLQGNPGGFLNPKD